ncbi:MAG: hypothetical protein JW709_09530, partial [Sedimentisphaerales bacterium]|nr:hypothetical protein [Sedimentisphaerales bacterium]
MMARKTAVPGCIYLNNGRYWWKVKLPGENGPKPRPLKPTGARYATKDPGVAETIAQEIWQRAAFKAKLPINDGSITALINAYLEHARSYYRKSKEAANIEHALTPLLEQYPTKLAEDFR